MEPSNNDIISNFTSQKQLEYFGDLISLNGLFFYDNNVSLIEAFSKNELTQIESIRGIGKITENSLPELSNTLDLLELIDVNHISKNTELVFISSGKVYRSIDIKKKAYNKVLILIDVTKCTSIDEAIQKNAILSFPVNSIPTNSEPLALSHLVKMVEHARTTERILIELNGNKYILLIGIQGNFYSIGEVESAISKNTILRDENRAAIQLLLDA